MIYLKKFETHDDYTEYICGSTKTLPNVSTCVDQPEHVHYNPWVEPEPIKALRFQTVDLTQNSLKFTKKFNPLANFEYSLDEGTTWNKMVDNTYVSFGNGNDLLVRGDNKNGIGRDYAYDLCYVSFIFSNNENKVKCSGNIMWLLDYSQDLTVIPSEYCFYFLFNQCEALVTAPELPATTLTPGCYCGMFSGCTSLADVPELPATTLAEACYSQLFKGCTSLVTAPELPATTLADYCYESMFQNCSSLTAAPELISQEFAKYCYAYMFNKCSMLENVTMLSKVIPSSLNHALDGWLDNASSSGTLTCASGMKDYLTEYVPEGWEIVMQ